MLLPAGELLNIVANHPTADGLVINPFSNSFIMQKEAIQALYNKIRTDSVEEKLKDSVGISQAISQYYEEQQKYTESEMPEELKRFFKRSYREWRKMHSSWLPLFHRRKKKGKLWMGRCFLIT